MGRFGAPGGGQTREHAQLAKSLGVDQLAVVVTKLDTCQYDAERFEHIKCAFVRQLLACLSANLAMSHSMFQFSHRPYARRLMGRLC